VSYQQADEATMYTVMAHMTKLRDITDDEKAETA